MTIEALPPSLQVIAAEVRTYLRELPRLLGDGHEGKCALIKGEQVLSIWDTSDDAIQAGYERFGLGEVFLAQPIDTRDLARPHPEELRPRTAS